MNILVYVHGHPHLRAGGSEMAAYALFRSLRAGGHDAVFLGVSETAFAHGRPALMPFAEAGSEYIMPDLISDHFLFVGGHRGSVLDEIVQLVRQRAIDVIHFHHFLGIGTDGLVYLRSRLPDVGFVFTAHEYLSLCARDGQMLMTEMRGRCYRPALEKCANCVSQAPPAYFALREALFRQVFAGFDAIISPSRFLAERLGEAKICRQDVHVVENANEGVALLEASAGEPSPGVNRFAFFGQINPFKGADLLLEAARLCASDARPGNPEFHIFGALAGDMLSYPYFIAHRTGTTGNVTLHGRYDGRQVIELMRGMDWIVVPSVWWENSPVVIEEALIAGRPVICSNIGGMAEKVEDGVFGLHFKVGNAADLAAKLKLACGNRDLWQRLVAGRRRPASPEAVAARHVEIYADAISSAQTACRAAHGDGGTVALVAQT